MSSENKIYYNFKSYKDYQKSSAKSYEQKNKNLKLKSIAGASLGVACTLAAGALIPKSSKHKDIDTTLRMLSMAAMGNIGGVLGGSIGADNKAKERKWREAGFQMMNTTIPMVFVTTALSICKKIKPLNKDLIRVIASIGAMMSGAALATEITNATREKGEKRRKYTIKDSVANFDDIVATIKIGFDKIEKYVPVGKILPFIYIYCGSRAGEKE